MADTKDSRKPLKIRQSEKLNWTVRQLTGPILDLMNDPQKWGLSSVIDSIDPLVDAPEGYKPAPEPAQLIRAEISQPKPDPQTKPPLAVVRHGDAAKADTRATATAAAPHANHEAVEAYKQECRDAGVKVTDEMIAKAANRKWNTRTPITKFKAGKSRTEGDEAMIRKVFRDKPHLKKHPA